MSNLFVPDDLILINKQINFDLTTETVSAIIFNHTNIKSENVLFALVRLLYHPLFSQYDDGEELQAFNMIMNALSYTNRSKTYTISLAQGLLNDFNVKHFLSNIQASALLIFLTLKNPTNNEKYQVNQTIFWFLDSLTNEKNLKTHLLQMLNILKKNPGELSTDLQTHLQGFADQRKSDSYPQFEIERVYDPTNEGMYKQFCWRNDKF